MSTSVVGSNFPDDPAVQLRGPAGGYGQNAFAGASNDLPGQRTKSGFLPDCNLDEARVASGLRSTQSEATPNGMPQKRAASKGGDILGPQTRHVPTTNVPTTFGMRNRSGEQCHGLWTRTDSGPGRAGHVAEYATERPAHARQRERDGHRGGRSGVDERGATTRANGAPSPSRSPAGRRGPRPALRRAAQRRAIGRNASVI